MNKVLGFLLAVVAVLGLSAAQAMARGGGHGGGHHGGGHHGGGHHGGHHSHHSSHSHHHTGHHTHTHHGEHSHHGDHHHFHHSNWAHHNRPFSHGWYGRHGGAWGYGWGGWGWGNPWAVSTFGATAAWLGLEAAEPYYGNYGTYGAGPNYLTSDETTESDTTEPETDDAVEESADENADNSESTTDETEENTSAQNETTLAPITPEQVASAKQLITEGKNDPPKDTSFLPLGVFSIAPEGQDEASALVQLAVSKAGQVRGTYYDLLTDHDQPIRGAVNKKTQQVAFTFGENGKVTFETSLANLTQPTGSVAAHFENGRTTSYTLARYAKEPSENEAGEEAPAAKPQSETAVQ